MNRALPAQGALSREDGKPIAIGEAHRLAQNDVMLGNVMAGEIDRSENHLQYALVLGSCPLAQPADDEGGGGFHQRHLLPAHRYDSAAESRR